VTHKHQSLEETFAWHHNNPPAPFNPLYVHETKAEEKVRHDADEAHEKTIPVELDEQSKRELRKVSRRAYWDAFVARKRLPC
jgi:hypothetical protein